MADVDHDPAEPNVPNLKFPDLYRRLILATLDDPPSCQADPSLWNSADFHDRVFAARICQRCPHVELCADHAIANDEPTGVWGATTAAERRAQRRTSNDDKPTG